MSMLELSHVKKSFKENPVIRDISISVEQGDVVAVLGPSGSGKTTLLRCAGYLSQADGGTVTLDGETFDLHRISKRDVVRYRRKIGFVFQSFNLFGNKTALQNVTAGLTIARKMDKKEAERIGLVKDTSLAYSVALVEILASAQRIAARTYDYFWLYLEAAVVYLIICSILTVLQRRGEKALEARR